MVCNFKGVGSSRIEILFEERSTIPIGCQAKGHLAASYIGLANLADSFASSSN